MAGVCALSGGLVTLVRYVQVYKRRDESVGGAMAGKGRAPAAVWLRWKMEEDGDFLRGRALHR